MSITVSQSPVLCDQQPKDIQFTIVEDQGNQQYSHFEDGKHDSK